VLGGLVALAGDLATSLPGGQQVLHINHVSAVNRWSGNSLDSTQTL
jgi:hypothetical protein